MYLTFKRKAAFLPGTVLNPVNIIRISEKTHYAALNFCDGREWSNVGEWCGNCPFQGKKLVEKGKGWEKRYATDTCDNVVHFSFAQPSNLPIRRIRDINLEVSEKSLVGFKSVQEAIDTLVALRDAINNATPFLSSESAPTPSSSSLISDGYFS